MLLFNKIQTLIKLETLIDDLIRVTKQILEILKHSPEKASNDLSE